MATNNSEPLIKYGDPVQVKLFNLIHIIIRIILIKYKIRNI